MLDLFSSLFQVICIAASVSCSKYEVESDQGPAHQMVDEQILQDQGSVESFSGQRQCIVTQNGKIQARMDLCVAHGPGC